MKKLIAILLAVLMIVSTLVSCGGNDETTTTETTTTEPPTPEPPAEDNNDNNDTEEVYGNAILYIKRLSGPIALNYKNVFEATSEYFDNSHKVSSKVTININGENITLDYDESFYDIMKGYLVNKYGSKKPQYIVGLHEDGTILSIRNSSPGLAQIEIPENATPEEVLPLAKEFLSQFTDVSQYNDIERRNVGNNYTFNLYNVVNGYIIGRAIIEISDGKIIAINIDKSQKEITPLNYDKEKAEELLKQEIKDAYAGSLYQLISCEINNELVFAYIINDKIYFHYNSTVKYVGGTIQYTAYPDFLVPYDLVKVEN